MAPRLIITLGDPAGIGPEVILKSFQRSRIRRLSHIVVGSFDVLDYTRKKLQIKFPLQKIQDISEHPAMDAMLIYDINNVDMARYTVAQERAEYGKASYEYLEFATRIALSYFGTALVTAPIHKGAIHQAGINFPGHTEILESFCKTISPLSKNFVATTMFVVHNLRVFFYTRHLSLPQAISALDTDKLVQFLHKMDSQLKGLGFEKPHLAVSALNPHASDHGLFGDEEARILEPAVKIARQQNIFVDGPIPADSVFYQAAQGKYTAVLSLYHDQGHIACKSYDFEKTISVTLGLPFLRTSVDHGTAFDIAGKNLASCVSMEEAILKADELLNQQLQLG